MTNASFFRTVLLFTLAVTFSMTACQKGKDGEVGPQGAAGPKGDAGAQGPKGDPGTANVIYSPWIGVTFTGSGTSYTGSITAAAITQAVLDKADIRVYWNEGGRVLSLPYAQTVGGTPYSVHQRFYVGRIDLLASYALTAQQMRYVIIPGAVPTGRQSAVDLSDYESVKAYYHIPD
ncbi:collagen-like protein [Fibrella sp. WM1]|uniref:collagen-like protein n=1 Tax=Fibrella musci TaxID=3242485 RepID=UPI003521265B